MSDIAEKFTRRRRLRNAALVAVLVPAALLAACAPQPVPPPPQPVAVPAPPPPPLPAPPPMVRGERG